MIRRPPRSTQSRSSAASDVYKRQDEQQVRQILLQSWQTVYEVATKIELQLQLVPPKAIHEFSAQQAKQDAIYKFDCITREPPVVKHSWSDEFTNINQQLLRIVIRNC
eukprot:TRINITY_DN577_c0_g1_i1.p2 TRINITY_DN577_c0_g1~~TRINITY_DN577_c0_g1_i1.p2  ORF type:complete len:108 (+),score=34.83 TRINITY_DN577_c0_g1_i1:1-324(+)